MHRLLLTLAPLFLLAGCAGTKAAASAAAPPPPRPVTAEEAVENFEVAWTTIRDEHFDRELSGVDWDAVHAELLPRAENARDIEELRDVIRDMLARLGQSHFGLIPREALPGAGTAPDSPDAPGRSATAETDPRAAPDAPSAPETAGEEQTVDEVVPAEIAGDLGIDVRARDGRMLVVDVYPEGPAAAAGVRRGWSLRSLDGWEVPSDATSDPDQEPREARFEARVRTLRRTSGPVGSEVEAVFLDDRDRRVTVELERAERDVIAHSFGTQLPTFYLRFHSETYERDGRRLGLIHFSNWFLPMAPRIDAAVDAMRDYDGIVIDLRGNSGGAGVMVMGTSGHFFADRRELGRMQTRVSTMTFRANPRLVNAEKRRVRVFDGPLAILVDETSASASEMFAGCMQDTGRARIFGETTAGAVLPAKTTPLPDGDALLHAFADFVTVRGTRLEHRGVIPDELVPVDRERLLAGADAPVEAALSWLARTAGDRTAGAPTAGE